ncbi:MAG: cyclic nucleotide-binding domain-containing protein [Deltaproteobacteria bacterium]|nr:cyclic nucleotide-binding domain-containing protein [Deltaproteobacteria bacterium]
MVNTVGIGEPGFEDESVRRTLDSGLRETDFYARKSRRDLRRLGLSGDEALLLLARHSSMAKYGYTLSPETVSHLLGMAGEASPDSPLRRLAQSPLFLMKAGWIYEHAPYYLFRNEASSRDLDSLITRFAEEYEQQFLLNRLPTDQWEKLLQPWRVIGVTFWENQTFDPLALLDKARRENLLGCELSVDFHPFNYRKLLPEEFSPEKRRQIREAALKAGLKIDIHSPIVGPYAPFPDPRKGRQLFFDPLKCFRVQCETIDLARDIGAGAVVIHLIDPSRPAEMAKLVARSGGSGVRVTFENYCQTPCLQSSGPFLAGVEEIMSHLPEDVLKTNFGITLDVGHLNIEGEDPLEGAERIGLWCLAKGVPLRLHATDNYGRLLFTPPAYSADVHSNVSGRGINNTAIIKLLRSMGHHFDVVAEQIQPLTREDILLIHEAQTEPLEGPYESWVSRGAEEMNSLGFEPLIPPSIRKKRPYLFLAGLFGLPALKEYLVFRKIQEQKSLSVEEAKKISTAFMRMPLKFRNDLIEYIDDLLLPVQSERGVLEKSELDLICQNISGALFGTLNNEHLDKIFSKTETYGKGEVICRQHTPGQAMYYIKEGEVTVLIDDTPLATLGPGEIFGEISLFYNVARTATIVAATDAARIGVLDREAFESLLLTGRPHTYDLIYRLYNILPERLRNLNEKYRTAFNALYLFLDRNGDGPEVPGEADIALGTKGEWLPAITLEEALSVFREIREYGPGALVFAEGDAGDGAYMILEGRVKVITFSERFDEITLGEMGKGDIFGEMALIDDKPRSAGITTITPCKLAFVDKKSFNDSLLSRSDLSFRLMANICLSLFKRILALDRVYAELKKAVA